MKRNIKYVEVFSGLEITKTQWSTIITELKEIEKDFSKAAKYVSLMFLRANGVCYLFASMLLKLYNKNVNLMDYIDVRKFPQFSKNLSYPVRFDERIDPELAQESFYLPIVKNWDKETKYGANRYKFFAWVITELERVYINGGRK